MGVLIGLSAYLACGWTLCCIVDVRWPRAAWVTVAWLPLLVIGWTRELAAPFAKTPNPSDTPRIGGDDGRRP